VDVDAMRRNLELTRGAILGERVTFLLAERVGRRAAHELVAAATERAAASGRSLREELEQEVDLPGDAFDLEFAVASATAVVDRTLERYGAVR
jgi:3-carboxy-cis,cis-muconate cycloisomerase